MTCHCDAGHQQHKHCTNSEQRERCLLLRAAAAAATTLVNLPDGDHVRVRMFSQAEASHQGRQMTILIGAYSTLDLQPSDP